MSKYTERLDHAKDIPAIFEIVKDAVRTEYKATRPGLMLGLADLGGGGNQWIGGYHMVASNAIIMNSRPLKYVETKHPELYKPYVFLILLHEYIHTLGIYDEGECRSRTKEVTQELFGDHLVTKMAQNIEQFLPYVQQVQYGWRPSQDPSIYYLVGFDQSSVPYFI